MYRIIGADGKEYGPVAALQLGKWIAEGRVNAETRAIAEGSTEWKPLGSFPEFSLCFGQAAAPPPRVMAAAVTGLAPPRRTNAAAVTGLVLALFSLTVGFCCWHGMPFSVLGILFSLVALSQIKQNPQVYDGKSIAIAGLILSLLSVVLGVILFLAFTGVRIWHGPGHHLHRL